MMKLPPKDFTYLWNDDTPKEERHRLMPYLMESHILHIYQVRQKAIANHKRLLAELNDWENNIRNDLQRYKRELNVKKGGD